MGMLSQRAAKPCLAALILCVCAPLTAQTVRPSAAFELVDVSCQKTKVGSTVYYPDPSRDQEMFDRVFGEGVRVFGVVGRRDGGWTRLPRFWATLKAWKPDGSAAHPVSSYSLRVPDPKDRRLYENVNAVAINIFSHGNPEVLLKVFVGAGPFGGLDAWVFAAAATDLPMELRLWDVMTYRLATWRKGPGPAVALTDTTTMLPSDCFACGQNPWC